MRLIFLLIVLIQLVCNGQSIPRSLGNKSYEISNHLGNVMVVVSDRKTATQKTTTNMVAFNETNIKSFNDYYPYGMLLENRNGSSNYRYGFQGQEKDNEVKDKNNSINYKYRVHDPRLGRFFAVDPLYKRYPYNSQYAFSENIVINAVELEGLEKQTLSSTKTVPINTNDEEAAEFRNKAYEDHVLATPGGSDQIANRHYVNTENIIAGMQDYVQLPYVDELDFANSLANSVTNPWGLGTNLSADLEIGQFGIIGASSISQIKDLNKVIENEPTGYFLEMMPGTTEYGENKIEFEDGALFYDSISISKTELGASLIFGINASIIEVNLTTRIGNNTKTVTYQFNQITLSVGPSAGAKAKGVFKASIGASLTFNFKPYFHEKRTTYSWSQQVLSVPTKK